jgi:hypothetical protein
LVRAYEKEENEKRENDVHQVSYWEGGNRHGLCPVAMIEKRACSGLMKCPKSDPANANPTLMLLSAINISRQEQLNVY